MRNIFYLITLAAIGFQLSSCSPKVRENQNLATNQISIGVKDSLYSETLGEQREIWVHVPETNDANMKFPILYVLDGEFHFHTVVGIVRMNALSGLVPEMIIVAIPNTNRFRDLTTSHVGDENNPSGGAENFTQFIERELIPFIENKYPAISYRTLLGHSLSGLVVVNTLINHPHLFQNYLAMDPSLSWDKEGFLEKAKTVIQETEYENKSLYTAIANTLRGGMTFEEAQLDTTTATLHLRAIHEFSKVAKSNDRLVSDWKYYPNETHGTVPVIAEHDALRFMFSWYPFEDLGKFYAPDSKLTGDELVNLLVSYYEKISSKFGYKYDPTEEEVNQLAFMYLDRKDYEKARPFFELNVRNYPESASAFEAMGDYYEKVSDRPNAIENYEKSLQLGGGEGSKEKLEALKK